MKLWQILCALFLLATSAFAQPSGSIGLWTATETSRGGSQALVVASRAEGEWVLPHLDLWARADADADKDTSVDITNPGTYRNVMAAQVWVGFSTKPLLGPLRLAMFGGWQKSLQGGELGYGTATNSLCGGVRVDGSQGYGIVGVCNRYAPLSITADGPEGPALVATMAVRVKDHVRMAANAGLRLKKVQTGPHDSGLTPMGYDWKFTFGPVVTPGK